jgi:phospholipase D1/2
MSEDSILYWAHHEKLCVVDGEIAFMGGLDLCFGRWDTNQHSIADAHPGDLDEIVFPGQDYNNARIMDFQDVANWQNNKLDRKYNSRMGWSDMSISLRGPVVEDLRAHFAQRWNFIYFEKYASKDDGSYKPINFQESRIGIIGHPYQATGGAEPEGHGQYAQFRQRMEEQFERGKQRVEEGRERIHQGRGVMHEGKQLMEEGREEFERGKDRLRKGMHRGQHGETHDGGQSGHPAASIQGEIHCQIMRSCTKWSHGVPVEHSIANAYMDTIKNSKHFVYIENQFFITATDDAQKPVYNKIGAAITERIIRAAKNNENWHMIVAMPSVPAFAGDLKADDALGTRAIMEFQYNGINRSGHSIMEKVKAAGFEPMEYIRFYNLRNYDRINTGKKMKDVEKKAGVDYDDARRGFDQRYGHAGDSENYGAGHKNKKKQNDDAYQKYQQAAKEIHGGASKQDWDSVASCYMLGGQDIRNVPWDGDAQSELDAFVSEELYIHSKLMIVDDRTVICGSANLNDRSQLGSHDSEIAICIEDQAEIDSYMGGQPWKATKFAASLRRQIFRKHLGLIPPQDMQRPDQSFTPVGRDPNLYDWGSKEDHAVADPLAPSFHNLWKQTARTNTEAFRKIFHPVPDDTVKNWKQYDAFYEKYFKLGEAQEEKKQGKDVKPATWKIGHVVKEEFSPGDKGLQEVKEVLSRVRGTLVEMPLMFLKEEDIAKEGLSLNALTEEVYT